MVSQGRSNIIEFPDQRAGRRAAPRATASLLKIVGYGMLTWGAYWRMMTAWRR